MNPPTIDKQKLLTKPDALQELLRTHDFVFVHVDTRMAGVQLPKNLLGKVQVVLQFGHDMPIPMKGLRIDDDEVRATLSFGRTPFRCVVPWGAIYLIVGDSGWGAAWQGPTGSLPDQFGPETPRLDDHQNEKAARRRLPPGWKVIPGGK